MVLPPLTRSYSSPSCHVLIMLEPPNAAKELEDFCHWKGPLLPCTRLTDIPRAKLPKRRQKRPVSPGRFMEPTENATMRQNHRDTQRSPSQKRLRRSHSACNFGEGGRRTWSSSGSALERADYERFRDVGKPKPAKWW